VGVYTDSSFNPHGFVHNVGSFSAIDFPGATGTDAFGINVLGQIVGLYFDSTGSFRGFLDNGGSFSTIDFPGSRFTQADSINNSGYIVGVYTDMLGSQHGFLAAPVPEPNTLLLFGSGLACLRELWRRRRDKEPLTL
jgi:hypothetical protein